MLQIIKTTKYLEILSYFIISTEKWREKKKTFLVAHVILLNGIKDDTRT